MHPVVVPVNLLLRLNSAAKIESRGVFGMAPVLPHCAHRHFAANPSPW